MPDIDGTGSGVCLEEGSDVVAADESADEVTGLKKLEIVICLVIFILDSNISLYTLKACPT